GPPAPSRPCPKALPASACAFSTASCATTTGPPRSEDPRRAAMSAAYNGAMNRHIAAYRFTGIADPQALAADLRVWAEAADLRGTVLVAAEGVNLFLAGTDAGIEDFLRQLRGDARLGWIEVKDSWSEAVPFARLKVK